MYQHNFPKVTSYLPSNCPSSYIDGKFVRSDKQYDGGIKTMWIIRKVATEEVFNQPVPEEHHCHHLLSMEHSLDILINETKNRCTSYPYSHSEQKLPTNLRRLIFQGNHHFHYHSNLDIQDPVVTKPWDRFTSILSHSRRYDDGYKIFLHNCTQSGVNFELGIDDNLPFYIRRKLDPMTPLTTLDAYVVANAFNAELTIYEVHLTTFDTTCTYQLINYGHYSHASPFLVRPKWIILYDIGTKNFYPMCHELVSSAGYGFRPNHFNSYVMDSGLVVCHSQLPVTYPLCTIIPLLK